MTHDELRAKAMSVLRRPPVTWTRTGKWKERRAGFACGVILSELASVAGDIPDAIGWSYGHSVLIECKVSRSDFFRDAKKPQRQNGSGAGERRFYMVPKGLIEQADLPQGWGLLEVDGREVMEVVPAPRRTLDLAAHVQEKLMLLSTIRRIRTREFLIIQREDGGEGVVA
jgi:hypothetical protein